MRAATTLDVPAVRKVLAEAFETDPLLRWIFEADEHRLEMTAAWLGLFVESYTASGRVDVLEEGGGVAAAAIWRMPNDVVTSTPAPPTPMGLLSAFVGADRCLAIGRELQKFAEARPKPPYAYLHFLAVAPTHQRQGLGTQLIGSAMTAADDANFGVVLETTNATNLRFYTSLGFVVTATFRLGTDGPTAWAMWRDPVRA